MSNLKSYQTLTTVAKYFGGGWGLLGATAALGYGVGKLIEVSGEALAERVQRKKERDHLKWLLENKTFGAAINGRNFNEEGESEATIFGEETSPIQHDNEPDTPDD